MSIKKDKGAFSDASWFWVAIVLMAAVYEFAMIAAGKAGGALSHVVWHWMGDFGTWQWALVGSPIIGLLLWTAAHFAFQWGEGYHLLSIIAGVFLVMGSVVVLR